MDAYIFSCINASKMNAAFPLYQNYDTKCNFSCRANHLNMRKNTNYYKVLALDSEKVGVDAIKRAYRSMALLYHPDVCPPSKREEFTKMFVELQRAYETLSDPVLRKKHDHQLSLIQLGVQEEHGGVRRETFPKDVWINQLNELKARSNRKKKMKCL